MISCKNKRLKTFQKLNVAEGDSMAMNIILPYLMGATGEVETQAKTLIATKSEIVQEASKQFRSLFLLRSELALTNPSVKDARIRLKRVPDLKTTLELYEWYAIQARESAYGYIPKILTNITENGKYFRLKDVFPSDDRAAIINATEHINNALIRRFNPSNVGNPEGYQPLFLPIRNNIIIDELHLFNDLSYILANLMHSYMGTLFLNSEKLVTAVAYNICTGVSKLRVYQTFKEDYATYKVAYNVFFPLQSVYAKLSKLWYQQIFKSDISLMYYFCAGLDTKPDILFSFDGYRDAVSKYLEDDPGSIEAQYYDLIDSKEGESYIFKAKRKGWLMSDADSFIATCKTPDINKARGVLSKYASLMKVFTEKVMYVELNNGVVARVSGASDDDLELISSTESGLTDALVGKSVGTLSDVLSSRSIGDLSAVLKNKSADTLVITDSKVNADNEIVGDSLSKKVPEDSSSEGMSEDSLSEVSSSESVSEITLDINSDLGKKVDFNEVSDSDNSDTQSGSDDNISHVFGDTCSETDRGLSDLQESTRMKAKSGSISVDIFSSGETRPEDNIAMEDFHEKFSDLFEEIENPLSIDGVFITPSGVIFELSTETDSLVAGTSLIPKDNLERIEDKPVGTEDKSVEVDNKYIEAEDNIGEVEDESEEKIKVEDFVKENVLQTLDKKSGSKRKSKSKRRRAERDIARTTWKQKLVTKGKDSADHSAYSIEQVSDSVEQDVKSGEKKSSSETIIVEVATLDKSINCNIPSLANSYHKKALEYLGLKTHGSISCMNQQKIEGLCKDLSSELFSDIKQLTDTTRKADFIIKYPDFSNGCVFVDGSNVSPVFLYLFLTFIKSCSAITHVHVVFDTEPLFRWDLWAPSLVTYEVAAKTNSHKNSGDILIAYRIAEYQHEKEYDKFILVSSDSDYCCLCDDLAGKLIIIYEDDRVSAKYLDFLRSHSVDCISMSEFVSENIVKKLLGSKTDDPDYVFITQLLLTLNNQGAGVKLFEN